MSDCFIFVPSEQFFNYFMARTSYVSMRWWWRHLYTRPLSQLDLNRARSLKKQFAEWHVAPFGYSILIPKQPLYALFSKCCVLRDMSLLSDTVFWFRSSHYLLFFLNAACLAEKQQIPIVLSLILPDLRFKPTIYRARGEHANHYTTGAIYLSINI